LRKAWLAIEQSPLGIIVTDTDGRIEVANPAFSDLSGYAGAEILGRKAGFWGSGQTPAGTYRDLWTTVGRAQALYDNGIETDAIMKSLGEGLDAALQQEVQGAADASVDTNRVELW
jgi:PAS domain-containing protein